MMKSSHKKAIPFADIYHKMARIQSSVSVENSSGSTRSSLYPVTLFQLQQKLSDFSSSLQRDSESASSDMKTLLSTLPKQLHSTFTHWLDSRDLDVLHLCIIYNKPDIIKALLDNELFPGYYVPNVNPYAHLAAYLGHVDCLETLLNSRPEFYFKTTKPQHIIVLPKDMMSQLSQKDNNKSNVKHVQKMLRKVGESSMNDEIASELTRDSWRDMDMEKAFTTSDSRWSKYGKSKRPGPAVAYDSREADKKKKSSQISVLSSKDISRSDIEDKCACDAIREKGKHVITVFVDCLQDEPGGVVRGAGPTVNIKRPGEQRMEPPRLPKIEDLRSLRDRSRLVRLARQAPKEDTGVSSKPMSSVKEASYYNVDKSRMNTTNNAIAPAVSGTKPAPPPSKTSANNPHFKKIEMGVRTVKKYKEFKVVIDRKLAISRDDKSRNKTPLSVAAEKGHVSCVKYLLQKFLVKQHPMLRPEEHLTLAVKSRSPEAIAILLAGKYTREDYQSAILSSLRAFYPACLSVLLSGEAKDRSHVFGRENLFNILFTQSLSSDFRYEMMPEMTKTLINCREEVNARSTKSTHPLYTLITCAFNFKAVRQCVYYSNCLKILLGAKANPHYNEMKEMRVKAGRLALSRPLYVSAIHCIFSNAVRSLNFMQKPYWSNLIMHNFIDCIIAYDKTPRRILSDVLFCYMDYVCELGLDRKILRAIFRYGANPDFKVGDKYAINRFFDLMLPYLSQFEVKSKGDSMIDALMMICHSMSQQCLQEAFVTFLDEHLLQTPIQALPLTRQFCYQVNTDLKHPRTLVKLAADLIWKQVRRSSSNVLALSSDDHIVHLILPA